MSMFIERRESFGRALERLVHVTHLTHDGNPMHWGKFGEEAVLDAKGDAFLVHSQLKIFDQRVEVPAL